MSPVVTGGHGPRMKHIRINVTARDIEAGDIGTSALCPIEIAARRHKVLAWCLTSQTSLIGKGFTCSLPASAMRFIRVFDARQPVEPFSFYLMVPDGGGRIIDAR